MSETKSKKISKSKTTKKVTKVSESDDDQHVATTQKTIGKWREDDVGNLDDTHDNNVSDEEHKSEQYVSKYADEEVLKGNKREKNTTSVSNFSYRDYFDLSTPINELSNMEVLKVLISRAHRDGQNHLRSTLNQTLKALNFEVEFPEFRKPRHNKDDQDFPRNRKPQLKDNPFRSESNFKDRHEPPQQSRDNRFRNGSSFRERHDKYDTTD